jgi:hypothetical protein
LWRPFWKWRPVEIFQCRESNFDDNWFPTLKIFLPVAIFKMIATIPQKFNIVQYHQNLICG